MKFLLICLFAVVVCQANPVHFSGTSALSFDETIADINDRLTKATTVIQMIINGYIRNLKTEAEEKQQEFLKYADVAIDGIGQYIKNRLEVANKLGIDISSCISDSNDKLEGHKCKFSEESENCELTNTHVMENSLSEATGRINELQKKANDLETAHSNCNDDECRDGVLSDAEEIALVLPSQLNLIMIEYTNICQDSVEQGLNCIGTSKKNTITAFNDYLSDLKQCLSNLDVPVKLLIS